MDDEYLGQVMKNGFGNGNTILKKNTDNRTVTRECCKLYKPSVTTNYVYN